MRNFLAVMSSIQDEYVREYMRLLHDNNPERLRELITNIRNLMHENPHDRRMRKLLRSCTILRSLRAQPCIRTDNYKSAFKNRIRSIKIENLTCVDTFLFLKACESTVFNFVRNGIREYENIKVSVSLTAQFVNAAAEECTQFINSKYIILYPTSNLEDWYTNDVTVKIITRMEEKSMSGSGWALKTLQNLIVQLYKYAPLTMGCNIKIPRGISQSKGVVNVITEDDKCLLYAVAVALKKQTPGKNVTRPSAYTQYIKTLNVEGINFPVTEEDIIRFERLNNISICIWSYEPVGLNTTSKSGTQVRYDFKIYYQSQKYAPGKHAELLLTRENEKAHLTGIVNKSRLMRSHLKNERRGMHFCPKCKNFFRKLKKFDSHVQLCEKEDDDEIEYAFPTVDDRILKFKNWSYKITVPYIVYGDIESILRPIERGTGPTGAYQEHIPSSIGYYIHCSFDEKQCKYNFFQGVNCIQKFAWEMKRLAFDVGQILKTVCVMEITPEEQIQYDNANTCHICEEEITSDKVRDHDHLTGVYRGPAHNSCNLNYNITHIIPIVFHNLSNYDSHFLIKTIASFHSGAISVVPVTAEKYISFTKFIPGSGVQLRFIDSLRFMNSSLEKLASYLNDDQKKILSKYFKNKTCFDLVKEKGVFPYDFVDSLDALNLTSLPTKDQFYNKLNKTHISQDSYDRAVVVWQTFNCKNMWDYSNLYLKTDVLLLADVFENFRETFIVSHKLDPAHYISLPSYSWDCCLLLTKVELELLTDEKMYNFFQSSIRGGLAQVSHKYAEANNKYMLSYDCEKSESYIMYYDVNNLYGWAMSECLPIDGFEWDLNPPNVNDIPDNGPVGYMYEVDIEYPKSCHDLQSDFPLCPINEYAPGSDQKKLLATLLRKNNYVLHHRNLKQAISLGVKVCKIHKAVKFNQSRWLKKYIDCNNELRKKSTNEFGKNLHKLSNNSVYGKTLEDVRKYRDVRLCSTWEKAEKLMSKWNFESVTVFDDEFVAVEMKKTKHVMKKPSFEGGVILDLAKLHVADFHYNVIVKNFKSQAKLIYTDTDSLIYKFENCNIYEFMRAHPEYFDTSDYSEDNIYGIGRHNKKVLGLMKDEMNGVIIRKIVALRAKLYAYLREDDYVGKRAKGVKRNVLHDEIHMEDYQLTLNTKKQKFCNQTLIKASKHKMYTIKSRKIALSAEDDKRYPVDGTHETLPWGHYKTIGE